MQNTNKQLASLVVKLQQGESGAFESIYNLTREQAYFTALKISKKEEDAEDILQDAYVYMLEKIGTLDKPESFKSWFNQIVANKAKDLMRKNHPERYTSEFFTNEQGEEVSKFDLMEDDDKDFIPDASVENTELCSEVMKMIDSLSDEKRAAVILYYYDEMTTREIAESLGVNENTVKSRLVQAKKDLAKSVTEYEKKHGKLLGVAPIPLVIWALKAAGAAAASSSVASGAAATTLAAVTAGTAVAGTAAGTAAGVTAGAGIATKIIAGVVAAAIVGGGAIAGAKVVQNNRKKKQAEQTTVTETFDESTTKSHHDELVEKYTDIIIPEDKLVDTVFEDEDLGYGVTLRRVNYIYDTPNGREVREGKPVIYRNNYNAGYDDLSSMASQNSSKYSSDINSAVNGINAIRERNGASSLAVDSKLSEQAGVRAAEIAMSGKVNPIRPDGTNYTSVFDRNGYTAGTRKELRAWRCNSPEDAIKKWQSDGALSDASIEKIGIGVAKDPETDDFIYVAHLYSDKESGNNEETSLADKLADKWNSNIDNINASNDDALRNLNEAEQRVADIPIIGDILTYDFHNDAFMMLLQSAGEKLTETINDLFDGV